MALPRAMHLPRGQPGSLCSLPLEQLPSAAPSLALWGEGAPGAPLGVGSALAGGGCDPQGCGHGPRDELAPSSWLWLRTQQGKSTELILLWDRAPTAPSLPCPLQQGETGNWIVVKTKQKVLTWTGGHSWPGEPIPGSHLVPPAPCCAQGWALRTRAKGWFVFDVPVTHLLSNLVISLI